MPKEAALEEASSRLLRFHNFRALPRRRSKWRILPTRFEWHDIEVIMAVVVDRNERSTRARSDVNIIVPLDLMKGYCFAG